MDWAGWVVYGVWCMVYVENNVIEIHPDRSWKKGNVKIWLVLSIHALHPRHHPSRDIAMRGTL